MLFRQSARSGRFVQRGARIMVMDYQRSDNMATPLFSKDSKAVVVERKYDGGYKSTHIEHFISS